MAFVNMFNDRVEQFNLREENERLADSMAAPWIFRIPSIIGYTAL